MDNRNKMWTAAEEARLVALFDDGENLAAIARSLGRTEKAVEDRLRP